MPLPIYLMTMNRLPAIPPHHPKAPASPYIATIQRVYPRPTPQMLPRRCPDLPRCCPDLPRCYPDATQMLPRCYPDATQMLPRCCPDLPRCLLLRADRIHSLTSLPGRCSSGNLTQVATCDFGAMGQSEDRGGCKSSAFIGHTFGMSHGLSWDGDGMG